MAIDWGGYLSEGAGGAATGASIGSIIPGIGTGIGAAVGGGLGLLHHLLGSGSNDPYQEAKKQAQTGWSEAQNWQTPYQRAGTDQYPRLNQASDELLHPEILENKWASGYENSPYAKQLLSQNQSSGLDAASQMGLLGSSAALGNIQQGAGNIVNEQRRQYMEDLMKKYLEGIGLSKGIYGIGAETAGNLGLQAMTQGENMANLGYAQKAAPQELLGKELNFSGNLLANKYLPNYGVNQANNPANNNIPVGYRMN